LYGLSSGQPQFPPHLLRQAGVSDKRSTPRYCMVRTEKSTHATMRAEKSTPATMRAEQFTPRYNARGICYTTLQSAPNQAIAWCAQNILPHNTPRIFCTRLRVG
jgi:hypothetical protein